MKTWQGGLVVITSSNPTAKLRKQWAETLRDTMSQQGEMTRQELRKALADYGVQVSEQAIGTWLRAEAAPRPAHQAAIAAIFHTAPHRMFAIPEARRAS